MKNSDKFLSAYNKLDHFLRAMNHSENHVSFSSLVHRLSEKKRVIKQYKKQLSKYNELRNIIVHERLDGQVIAEPNDFALAEFEKICDNIMSPKSIHEVCQNKVRILQTNDMLTDALRLMKSNDYSQLPVYEDKKFVCMLNADTISAWLRSNIDDELVSITETNIAEVIKFRTTYKKTVIKSRRTNIYDILDIYKKNVYEPVQIDAILITHNGKDTEKPLAIITDEDIPMILSNF